ncbi:MAG: hypothetical protein HQL93_08725 [Magnetococcales bacterium]|nr:hypothetical protein [Magnetococcales bacterium]
MAANLLNPNQKNNTMPTPPVTNRFSRSRFCLFLTGGFVLFILINLFTFHTNQTVYLEKYHFNLARKRSIMAQNLSNAISQVQNQLTDISATLGLDHLDQGFERARQAADTFHTELTNLHHILNKRPPCQKVPLDPATLQSQFDQFYAQGIDMANAYIQNGTLRGNQKMKQFDKQADDLREMLGEWNSSQTKLADHWQKQIDKHADAFVVPSGLSNTLWLQLMGSETRTHYVQFITHWIQSASLDEQHLHLGLMAQELHGAVIQVQQWLTDLSATRGQDGLDEGLEQANKNAQRFQDLLPNFLLAVQQNGNPEWIQSITGLDDRFKIFHAKGRAMAEAYIQGGAKLGNPLMLEFDTMADSLGKELLPLIIPSTKAANSENFQMDIVYDSLQQIRKVLFFLFFLSLLAFFGCIAWLISCKPRQ